MSRQTLIIIVIAVLFGGAGLWFFYFQSSSSTDATPTDARATDQNISANPDVQRIEQELVDLRRLKDLQLDTSILKNQFLQSLEPLKTPPSPPPVQNNGTTTTLSPSYTTPGRSNPFLPF
ncbi:MAG: DUF2749 domain-containing protein [Candidatus Sungbacteria bacterium]|nr:DUF2749 domain-containing protein [Candidatus Sungbacteria bacterium]